MVKGSYFFGSDADFTSVETIILQCLPFKKVLKSEENRGHAIASSTVQGKGEADTPASQLRREVRQEPWKTAQTDEDMMKKTWR